MANASSEFTITYDNGTEHHARVTMSDMCAAEARLARDGLSMEAAKTTGILRAVYHRLRKNGDVAEPFEAWLDHVTDFETPDSEEAEGDFMD